MLAHHINERYASGRIFTAVFVGPYISSRAMIQTIRLAMQNWVTAKMKVVLFWVTMRPSAGLAIEVG